jgi:hypothetical protein
VSPSLIHAWWSCETPQETKKTCVTSRCCPVRYPIDTHLLLVNSTTTVTIYTSTIGCYCCATLLSPYVDLFCYVSYSNYYYSGSGSVLLLCPVTPLVLCVLCVFLYVQLLVVVVIRIVAVIIIVVAIEQSAWPSHRCTC